MHINLNKRLVQVLPLGLNYKCSWCVVLPLQAPLGVKSQSPAELPYAAPFIPAPSFPPPEYSHQDAATPFQPLRKKAVLIGCNYTSIPEAALKGCVRDANCLCQLLTAHYG